ncbi:hypothetical protein [Paraburkholderia sp. MM5384-R2]|uniref:hypothetical protein n=1 Tax=Paraburkholderia sp. MM5384-R2 TaxID=2723097 RepID=UPI00160EA0A2|nr:hypothetical protein [Paraburkholderia sp. MM5384-R2]MBB5497551.1 hypothetical protein [Paraburkholderia sp. MM5384-R2]
MAEEQDRQFASFSGGFHAHVPAQLPPGIAKARDADVPSAVRAEPRFDDATQ